MTTKAKYNIIINATQAAMLDVLRDGVEPSTCANLFAKMGISRAHGMQQMQGLRDQELVTEVTPYSPKIPATWSISMAGKRALCDYARKLEWAANRAMAAPPPTRDTLGTFYTPPSNVYYRNAGHTHIASHGVRC